MTTETPVNATETPATTPVSAPAAESTPATVAAVTPESPAVAPIPETAAASVEAAVATTPPVPATSATPETPMAAPLSLLSALDSQLAFTLSGDAAKEGSEAIAFGRSAGLAAEAGLPKLAATMWAKVPTLLNMPTLDEFIAGYNTHSANFATFGDSEHFPAGGTKLSNALGSYAFALDYLHRGDTALGKGNAKDVCDWGATALKAAGFAEKAALVELAWQQKNPPIAGVTTEDAKTNGTVAPSPEKEVGPTV